MNYYPFHLGDYAAHTSHLEPMEDIAYRRMLDLYYRTEKQLPLSVDEIARLIRMKDYAASIRDVLNEFFERTDDGWKHARCDEEIARMQDKQAKAKASAQASVNARRTNAQRTLNERSTEVELPTPTPIPTPKEEKRARALPPPEGVDNLVWSDWLALRKAKKAPVTATVIAAATAEAKKAGMTLEAFLRVWCARGSQGLQADWLRPGEAPSRAIPVAGGSAVPSAAETRAAQEADRSAPAVDPAKRRAAMEMALGAIKRVA